jgi:hypothetical protein
MIKKPSKYERLQDLALFESGVEDDDEDEDYSMNEDMLKNQKRYKFDEDWQVKNRISVPKSEIDKLIADQRKEVQETVPSTNNSMLKNPLKTNIIS